MFEELSGRVASFVVEHDLLVIACMLLVTGAVGAGVVQLDIEEQTDIDDDEFSATEVGQALEYVDERYQSGDDDLARSSVYVRPADGNALSRSSLLEALAYQESIREDPAVESELVGEQPIAGPPSLIGSRLAGENATLAEQQAAIERASDDELAAAIRASLSDPDVAGAFMPSSYEPGETTAESFRLRITFEQDDVTRDQRPLPNASAQQVLYDQAQQRESVFTVGTVAQQGWSQAQIVDAFLLIVPPALVLVLVVLAVAYRDPVDVLLGFVGVAVSVLWFFGILGWLGIPAGFASIVGPVLIVALSIDFGLHVFMRYREQRGLPIDERMERSMTGVTVAFLLVAITAGVGFLANVTSPIGFIRSFGVVITLGVFASAAVFVTLIPALKLRIDRTLAGVGIERDRRALGTVGPLETALSAGVSLAQRGAVVVIVLTLLVGAIGVVSYTQVDRQGFQQDFADEDDWQTELPDPIGWSAHETDYRQQLDYVQAEYQSDTERDRFTTILIRGTVDDPTAFQRIQAGTQAATRSDAAFEQGGTVPVVSPISLVRTVAVENPAFAALLNEVAAEHEGVDDVLSSMAAEDEAFATALRTAPEEPPPSFAGDDVTAIYDALYRIAPEESASVIEREDGEYRSVRLLVPVEQGLDIDDQGDAMHSIADETAGDTDLTVVPVGFATVSNAGLGTIADSILQTMLLAFLGVGVVLAGIYRSERDDPALGLLTVVPIVLVVGLVFTLMALFGVALTFITAFLVSITIGLGIDYAIHVSDRFAQEIDRGEDPVDALETTVTGTGGALLGSALTSCAAFSTLLLHPAEPFQAFGFIVVVALLLSFGASVLVFPSFLLWWARGPAIGGRELTAPTADASTGEREATDATEQSGGSTQTCQNCARVRTDARSRRICTGSDGEAYAADLCANCHAARTASDADCAGGVPVDRDRLLDRAGGVCECCGSGPAAALERHVIVPLAGRGHAHERNTALLCPDCHERAHDTAD